MTKTTAPLVRMDPYMELKRIAVKLRDLGMSPGRCDTCGRVFLDDDDYTEDEHGVLSCALACPASPEPDGAKIWADAYAFVDANSKYYITGYLGIKEEDAWMACGELDGKVNVHKVCILLTVPSVIGVVGKVERIEQSDE